MRFILSLALICIAFVGKASNELSPKAEIKLLTCGPGFEAYSLYGHTALQVIDTANNLDVVFNYGMFDMSQGNFMYNFAKGETDYKLATHSYGRFIRSYDYDERWVYSLDLNLSQAQKQKMYDALIENYKPENRVYRYSFFFDNCATRIRDLFNKTLGDSLQWKASDEYIALPPSTGMEDVVTNYMEKGEEYTFREIINKYQSTVPWLNFAIDIPIASSADRPMTFGETMFLPDFLMNACQNAVVTIDGETYPFATSPVHLVNPDPVPPVLAFYETPGFVMIAMLLLFIVLTAVGVLRNKHFLIFDSFLFFITGVMGLFLVFTSFISVHPVMTPNFNLWWAFPLNILFAILVYFKFFRAYIFKFTAVLYSAFILAYFFLPQGINILFVGFWGSVLVRSLGWILNQRFKRQ